MKKIYLFSLGLMASIGVWAYGTGDCKKYITSQSDVVSQLGAQGSTIETSNNHMTVLVRVAGEIPSL